MDKQLTTSILVVLGIVGLLGFVFYTDSIEDGITHSPKVALLFPVTGDFSTHGSENLLAANLAVVNFNSHLRDIDEEWKLDAYFITDTTNENLLETVKNLKKENFDFIIGPETSAGVSTIKEFINNNGMIVISPSSTAPSLALLDNVYRLSPDDTNQGQAITGLLHQDEIKAIVLLTRSDTWGLDLQDSIKNAYLVLGYGKAGMPIMYDPKDPQYESNVVKVAFAVSEYQKAYADDEIAVIVLGFGESTEFLKSAATHDNLKRVQWYGTDSNANEKKITQDATSLEFAKSVDFTAVQFGTNPNPTQNYVKDVLYDQTGQLPSNYAYSSYDAVWILGNSILEADSTKPIEVQKVIHKVAAQYEGALGNIELNEAGDLKSADYDIWGIVDDKWNVIGKYIHNTGKIEMYG